MGTSPPPPTQLAQVRQHTIPHPATPANSHCAYDPAKVVAMAEMEYHDAQYCLRQVQDMIRERQAAQQGFNYSNDVYLYWAQREIERARRIRDLVYRVEGNTSMPSNASKAPFFGPPQASPITPVKAKAKVKATVTSPSQNMSATSPSQNANVTFPNPKVRDTSPTLPQKKHPKGLAGNSGPCTPGSPASSVLRSPYPTRKHYCIVRGRRIGVFDSW